MSIVKQSDVNNQSLIDNSSTINYVSETIKSKQPSFIDVTKSDYSFDDENAEYTIRTVIEKDVTIPAKCKLIFAKGGAFKNCKITGTDTIVVSNSEDNVIFDNCTFAGTYKTSTLTAKNFGAVDDMYLSDNEIDYAEYLDEVNENSTIINYGETNSNGTYKTYDSRNRDYVVGHTVHRRLGTDNSKNGSITTSNMGSFFSNSKNCNLYINGCFYQSFYRNANYMYLKIENANKLKIYGDSVETSQMIATICLKNCNNCDISNIGFVGYMDTPGDGANVPVWFGDGDYETTWGKNHTNEYNLNGVTYTIDNTFGPAIDPGYIMGYASHGVYLTNDGVDCTNNTIHDCSFKMRYMGVLDGDKDWNNTNAYCVLGTHIYDCTFDYITYQAVGLHSKDATIERCTGSHCAQAVDISEKANGAYVLNCEFDECGWAFKQQAVDTVRDLSFGNKIENSTFNVTDYMNFISHAKYLFQADGGLNGDTFEVVNCKFNMTTSSFVNTAIYCRAYKTLVKDSTFTFNLTMPTAIPSTLKTSWSAAAFGNIMEVIGRVGGAYNYVPLGEFQNCDFTFNGNGGICDFASPQGGTMSLTMNECNITSEDTIVWSSHMFTSLNNFTFTNNTIAAPSNAKNIFVACKSSKIINNTINVSSNGKGVYVVNNVSLGANGFTSVVTNNTVTGIKSLMYTGNINSSSTAFKIYSANNNVNGVVAAAYEINKDSISSDYLTVSI